MWPAGTSGSRSFRSAAHTTPWYAKCLLSSACGCAGRSDRLLPLRSQGHLSKHVMEDGFRATICFNAQVPPSCGLAMHSHTRHPELKVNTRAHTKNLSSCVERGNRRPGTDTDAARGCSGTATDMKGSGRRCSSTPSSSSSSTRSGLFLRRGAPHTHSACQAATQQPVELG